MTPEEREGFLARAFGEVLPEADAQPGFPLDEFVRQALHDRDDRVRELVQRGLVGDTGPGDVEAAS